ncbi:MAG: V-type ATPase subunit [Thaumarchaeota archaeon]|nr:V-type ATPase subunit [Nitrososphaerota archaeon]
MSSKVYLGTRSAALKGTLINPATLEKLAESQSLEELVNRLRGTSYGASLAKVQPPFTARRLELAFRERLADAHYLLTIAGSKYELINLYYLRNVAWDLKSALKSKALGKSYDESIEFLDMHGEELIGRRELIIKVLSAKDLQEASSLLSGTEFGEDIGKAVAAFSNSREIRLFDVYIDHAVLSKIAKAYSSNAKLYSPSRASGVGGVGEMVALDIDSYNILSVLRAKLWGLSESDTKQLVIRPTYRAQLGLLDRMISTESVAEAVKLVEGLYGKAQLAGGSDEELIDRMEETLTLESRRTAGRAFVWQGLGPAAALAIVKLIEFEVRNLAAIAIGVEARLPPKSVLSKLVL